MIIKFQNFKSLLESSNLSTVGNYFEKIKTMMVSILEKDKGMDNTDSIEFVNNIFTMDNKISKEIKNTVNTYYSNKESVESCSKFIIDKYYKMTQMNNTKPEYDLEEVSEINENNFYHYKKVSNSLFWNFIKKVTNLGVKFELDISIINDRINSLNNDNYLLYMESNSVPKGDIKYEFSHGNILSKILDYIDSEEIKFFISITKSNKLKFGYIVGDKTYTIGDIDYKSSDFKKLSSIIECTDNQVSIINLSSRLKSSILILEYYKNIFKNYLKTYIDLKIYTSIINDKLTLVIESDDDNIINQNYIKKIISDNNRYKLTDNNFELTTTTDKYKTFYNINLK